MTILSDEKEPETSRRKSAYVSTTGESASVRRQPSLQVPCPLPGDNPPPGVTLPRPAEEWRRPDDTVKRRLEDNVSRVTRVITCYFEYACQTSAYD